MNCLKTGGITLLSVISIIISFSVKAGEESKPGEVLPEVVFSYAHDNCSFQYSSVDFCDIYHMNSYRDAISDAKVNFSGRYVLLGIMEREIYHQRSLVILNPSTGMIYPFPFDSYSGPMEADGRIESDGILKFSLRSSEVCITGALKVQHEIKNGLFCFTFDNGTFSGYKTQYMYLDQPN